MRDLVGVVARRDLDPLFAEIAEVARDRPLELIDLGAGPDNDIEAYCRTNGIGYTAYDGNESFLTQRRAEAEMAGWQVDPARTILGRLEDMSAVADSSYDVSFSRAATAWTSDPDATIAGQLRITRSTAVFTEYDWTHAGIHGVGVHGARVDGAGVGGTVANAVAAANAAKFAMVLVLESASFKTEFGATLPERVAHVAAAAGYEIAQTSTRHELPVADHRSIFFDTAETILALLRAANSERSDAKSRLIAERLSSYLRVVREAPEGTLTIRLPALVTVTARIRTRPGGTR